MSKATGVGVASGSSAKRAVSSGLTSWPTSGVPSRSRRCRSAIGRRGSLRGDDAPVRAGHGEGQRGAGERPRIVDHEGDAHGVLLPQPRLQGRDARLVGGLDATRVHDRGRQRPGHVTRCRGERLRAGLHAPASLGDRVRPGRRSPPPDTTSKSIESWSDPSSTGCGRRGPQPPPGPPPAPPTARPGPPGTPRRAGRASRATASSGRSPTSGGSRSMRRAELVLAEDARPRPRGRTPPPAPRSGSSTTSTSRTRRMQLAALEHASRGAPRGAAGASRASPRRGARTARRACPRWRPAWPPSSPPPRGCPGCCPWGRP